MRLKKGMSEFRILNREDQFLRLFHIHCRNAEGMRIERKRMEAEDGTRDDTESAKGPGDELGKIVAGDVFYNFAAAACERAVGESNGDTDDEVAERAETKPQCAAVDSAEHAAAGGLFRPQRIKRHTLDMPPERFLQSL